MTNESFPPYRIGLGYDVHRTKEGRPLILGGVEIPSPFGLDGHSDADCLTHAIADAILGALGLSDIGSYFPNDDQSIEGIDSQIILRKAVDEARRLGWKVGNIDASLIAEKPKILPYVSQMKARLAESTGLPETHIGIKATTNEKLDDIGASKGIAAHAVCMLFRG